MDVPAVSGQGVSMVSIKHKFTYFDNGDLDLNLWLQHARAEYHLENAELIDKAAHLAHDASKGLTTFYGQPCIEQGLEMAQIILSMQLDAEAVAAAILTSSIRLTKLSLEDITEKTSFKVARLIQGVQQMDAIQRLPEDKARDQAHIDRLRKLFLAMVSDIRVVIIKLAEQTCIMRGIKKINPTEREHIAQTTMDIYAPLANRLGIGQLKWELEDVAFHYIDPLTYKTIAKYLAERRVDRETQIQAIFTTLKEKLVVEHIRAEISGRAKHIYSIYLKMQRKETDLSNIYDFSAIRLLVPTIEDCYTALSIVHGEWEHIPKEFDDYISSPKPNGYRSIHTAVIGPAGKIFEIQIRTNEMHEESERGVAAHWLYKEGKTNRQSGYESKIIFLRQLLDWHKDVAAQDGNNNPAYDEMLNDRVYVFTPAGDILDLPVGATPLDCAYHIHSEIGNHCRGAKINAHIVPLTYQLRTGDKVEILTNPNGSPSRDWMNPTFGYLQTPRARGKVAYWFRQLDLNQHIESGRKILEREFSRLNIHPNIQKLASHFNLKDEDTFLATLGRGHIRPTQVLHFVEAQQTPKTPEAPVVAKKIIEKNAGMTIDGISDLLTRIARCCKPIPGDAIVGFITQGRGVTIHKKSCNNVSHLDRGENGRLIQVNWDSGTTTAYYVDLQVRAYSRNSLLKEITTIISNAKINLINFNSTVTRNNMLIITLTIQILGTSQLKELVNQINHLKGILDVHRLSN
jgi:GTP pyrophosphokinase